MTTPTKVGDGMRKYTLNQRYFSSIDTEEKAYWLGFISADGCIKNTPKMKTVTVNLANIDRGHLEKMSAAVDSNKPIYAFSRTRNRANVITATAVFNSPYMIADLIALSITERKSLTLQPWTGPDELMRHYWRGIFDGDGCIHQRKRNQWHVGLTGTKEVSEAFRQFIQDHTGHVGAIRPYNKIFRANFGGTNIPQQIVALLYKDATISLDRKRTLADTLMALQPKRPVQADWSHLTLEYLEYLHQIHGSWPKVAVAIPISRGSLDKVLARLGKWKAWNRKKS